MGTSSTQHPHQIIHNNIVSEYLSCAHTSSPNMGQGFIFLNIDKRQQVRCGGAKYGETFLEPHTPAKLIKLLAVPEMGYNDGSQSLHRSRWASILPEEDNEPTSWAGDRIICIGELLQDWPESILAADNCKSLESPHFLYWNAVQTSSVRAPKYSGNGVLRNLTKKIYVRSEGIPILNRPLARVNQSIAPRD